MMVQDVVIACDVRCLDQPRYRAWVDQELFAERRWRWGQDHYLEEIITVRGPARRYHIRYELVPGDSGQVLVDNYRVISGPGEIDSQGNLEIMS